MIGSSAAASQDGCPPSRVAAGDFPKPSWISKRCKVWKESDISGWMAARLQDEAA